LSTKRNKVYYDPNTGKAVHTIAGTDSMKDWSNNALIPLGLHQYSNRSRNSTKIQKKANEKYGKSNVDLVSHSQSGHIAENLANKGLVGGKNTTLNPAIIGSHNKDIKVVKSIFDPVSALTKTTKKDVHIIPKTFNPITEHSTNVLNKKVKNIFGFGLDHGQNIQSILFKRPEWTLAKAKAWLKKYKYKTDVDEKPNHYRFRQFEPKLFKKYITKPLNGDKNENIEFIIGIKDNSDNKIMRRKQHDTDSEDHSECSSSEEEEEKELKGGALHEQDIIDRMAKLSHDIHVHHGKHGIKKSIVKGFKILGQGIMHTSIMKPDIKGGKINRSKKFNSWFKDIGNKFKPLNKNLAPIKHQMTQSAVDNIAYATMTPEQKMQSGVDMFGDVMGNFTGKSKSKAQPQYGYPQYMYDGPESYNSMYEPVIAQPVTESAYGGYYHDKLPFDFNSQPDSYARSSQPTQMGGFGLSFFDRKGGNDGKTHKEAMREKDNEKFTNREAQKSGQQTADIYNRGGFNTDKMKKDIGFGVGKELKRASAKATIGLINSGSSRAMHEMDTRGKKGGGFKKGSQEAKEWGRKMKEAREAKKK
jgi:hypothetical protein